MDNGQRDLQSFCSVVIKQVEWREYSINHKNKSRNLMKNNYLCILKSSLKSKEGGDIGLFITLVPKVYKTFFLFVGSTTLVTFVEF